MQAIINIELDDKFYHGMNLETKYEAVISTVRGWFVHCLGEICESAYTSPTGADVTVHTAVISVEFAGSKSSFELAINRLCEVTNQDCIAVLYDDGEGKLVGPRAEAWGDFVFGYFTLPRIYQRMKEAA